MTIPSFDQQHHDVCMDPGAHYHACRWDRVLSTGPLTDKKIAAYQARGYYSAEFKAARKELWERKAKERRKRQGNFDEAEDGRLIYRP